MRIGVALEMLDLESGRPVRMAEIAEQAWRAEELGYASAWVMDHYWMERGSARLGGHEAMTALAYLAARTRRIALGSLVLCNSFRHPGQLAREAAALADMAEGRVILGIGAGWHEPEYAAFDTPFDHRVSRLDESLQVLPKLLRGERVSTEGRYLRLRDASVLTTAPAPPVWVGGGGPRMLRLCARYGDGWNLVWPGADVDGFARLLDRLRGEIATAGRRPEDVAVSVGVLVLLIADGRREATINRARRVLGRDLDPRVVVTDDEGLADLAQRYREAGAEHLIVALAPSPFTRFDRSLMERAAPALITAP